MLDVVRYFPKQNMSKMDGAKEYADIRSNIINVEKLKTKTLSIKSQAKMTVFMSRFL